MIKGYVNTSAGQVHYRATSTPRESIPLVMLHQSASSSEMYEAMMLELQDTFWSFAPDTPGFGGSFFPQGKLTIPYYAQVIFESLKLMDITECWLFGHHTGSSIALQLTHDHPELVRKLVLCGPPCLSLEDRAIRKSKSRPIVIQDDGSHLMPIWKYVRGRNPPWPLALYHREAILRLHSGERTHEAYLAVYDHDFQKMISDISCPTLVMAGEFDSLRPGLEPAYAALKDGTMRIVPEADGYICDVQPKIVADILREFFV